MNYYVSLKWNEQADAKLTWLVKKWSRNTIDALLEAWKNLWHEMVFCPQFCPHFERRFC